VRVRVGPADRAIATAARRRRLLRARLVPPLPRPFPSPSAGSPPPARYSWASDAGAAAATVFHSLKPAITLAASLPPFLPLASSSRSAGQREPDKGTRGLAWNREGCGHAQKQSGPGGTEAASAPLPKVSAPLPGELSPRLGPAGRHCVTSASSRLSGRGVGAPRWRDAGLRHPPSAAPPGAPCWSSSVRRDCEVAGWRCRR
jgi:hypothetical protein